MSWDSPAHVIRVVSDDAALAGFELDARAGGALVISLDVAGMQDVDTFEETLKRVFRFPYPTSGFDAAIDLMADLDWMPSTNGYFLRIVGLDGAATEVANTVARLLPSVLDRWRSGGVPFVASMLSASSRGVVLEGLDRSNRFLAKAGSNEANVAEIAPVGVIVDGVTHSFDTTS